MSFLAHLSVYRLTQLTRLCVAEQYFSVSGSVLGKVRAFLPTKKSFSPQRSAFLRASLLQMTLSDDSLSPDLFLGLLEVEKPEDLK